MKIISLLIFSILFSVALLGQSISFKAGTTFSKLDWNFTVNEGPEVSVFDETLVGYSVFAGINYLESKFFYLSTDVGVLRKGGREDMVFTDQNGQAVSSAKPGAKLDYLSINTLINLTYPIENFVNPIISFGPRFDYQFDQNSYIDYFKETLEWEDFSYGFILGGGFDARSGDFSFGARLDYYLNLNDIAKWGVENNPGNFMGEVSDKTFSSMLFVAYNL